MIPLPYKGIRTRIFICLSKLLNYIALKYSVLFIFVSVFRRRKVPEIDIQDFKAQDFTTRLQLSDVENIRVCRSCRFYDEANSSLAKIIVTPHKKSVLLF